MVYTDSPSYVRLSILMGLKLLLLTAHQSLHASAFISRITVRSVTDPPPSSLEEPIVVSTYPFAVSVTTNIPFLAEVTLSLVGERNSDIVVQHWVEVRYFDPYTSPCLDPSRKLDPFKHEKSVLGDEQVLDVELDRSTHYRAPQARVDPAELLNASKQRAAAKSVFPKSVVNEVPPYARLLKSLLPRFPMTSRGGWGCLHERRMS